MYKLYFKQAIQMLKQNKFISIISILGTALAIMMIMTIILADEVKNINAAPEDKRDRMLYIDYQQRKKENITNGSAIKYDVFNDYLSKMKTPEYICPAGVVLRIDMVSREGSPDLTDVRARYTDDTFWKVFSLSFVKGRAFTREESESGISVAVVSESLAKELFKDQDPIGKEVVLNFFNYRIIGVVKDVSPIFQAAGGDIFVPYKSRVDYTQMNFHVYILAKDKKDFPAIAEEVRDCEKKYAINNDPWTLWIKRPLTHEVKSMDDVVGSDKELLEESIRVGKRKAVMIFIILLIVPAINLSGFSLSRIKKRREEIGIRKAFGAKKYVILTQVLYENMIVSLIGGAIGLAFSYVMVFSMRQWLLGVPPDTSLPANTMVSAYLFFAVFAVCFLLNLLSAGIPAYRASRMNIIDSINQKEN